MGKTSDRKLRILRAIIEDYIVNAEPIGSRTIAKKYDLGVSAATIRNEMSDLEEMGFLIQPHTSAGRIPSQKAYRLYVDQLMEIKKLDNKTAETIKNSYKQYVEQIEKSIKHTSELLAQFTSYTSIVMAPEISKLNYKLIQLLPIQGRVILMVIITEANLVKNYQIKLSKVPTQSELTKLTNILNYIIKDFNIFRDDLNRRIDELSLIENEFLQEILDVLKNLSIEDSDKKIYATGMTNILNYPEFKDIDKVRLFLEAFQEKRTIIDLLQDHPVGVNISIGDENKVEEFKDCSVLTATYTLNGDHVGTIGVVGPIRMNYDHVVSVLIFLSEVLNNHINNI